MHNYNLTNYATTKLVDMLQKYGSVAIIHPSKFKNNEYVEYSIKIQKIVNSLYSFFDMITSSKHLCVFHDSDLQLISHSIWAGVTREGSLHDYKIKTKIEWVLLGSPSVTIKEMEQEMKKKRL